MVLVVVYEANAIMIRTKMVSKQKLFIKISYMINCASAESGAKFGNKMI